MLTCSASLAMSSSILKALLRKLDIKNKRFDRFVTWVFVEFSILSLSSYSDIGGPVTINCDTCVQCQIQIHNKQSYSP